MDIIGSWLGRVVYMSAHRFVASCSSRTLQIVRPRANLLADRRHLFGGGNGRDLSDIRGVPLIVGFVLYLWEAAHLQGQTILLEEQKRLARGEMTERRLDHLSLVIRTEEQAAVLEIDVIY